MPLSDPSDENRSRQHSLSIGSVHSGEREWDTPGSPMKFSDAYSKKMMKKTLSDRKSAFSDT